LFRARSRLHTKSLLTGTHTPPFPPTRFILGPPVECTEKPLFLLRALPQKNSDFAVLIADGFNLEPVEWHHPVLGLLPLGMRANLRGSAYLAVLASDDVNLEPVEWHHPVQGKTKL